MSHWGGVGTLFGTAAHIGEIGKHCVPKSRRPCSARTHWVPSDHGERENMARTNRTPKDVTNLSIHSVLLDPFSISLGDAQLATLSYTSKKETAAPKDYTDRKLDVRQMLSIIRNELKSRGAYEIASIRAKFRKADKDDDDSLDFSEFEHLLVDQLNIRLSQQNLKELFQSFDIDHCNDIKYDHFLQQLRGEMSSYRKKFMNWIFDFIDKHKTGVIDMNDLLEAYNADGDPDVRARKIKPVDALKRFIKMFDVGGVPDGQVSKKEFEDYYASLSAGIDIDSKFEEIMKSHWNVSGTPPPSVQPPSMAPTATWESVQEPPGTNSKSIIWDKGKASEKPIHGKSPHYSQEESARHLPQDYRDQKLDLEKVLSIVRNELKSRGAYEIAGVRAKFRKADKDDDESLDFSEFKEMLTGQLDIQFQEQNIKELFQAFDIDHRNDIKYDHFLKMLNGEMNSFRKAVMDKIFTSLDKDKSGVIDVNDLLGAYDPEADPDVQAKKTKPVAAMKRFIKNFDIGGVNDGKVTRKEFEDYYASLSAGIDSDKTFESVLKNAWKHSSLMH
eukprot:gnl/MRDRNA2_/MRDRNA2_40375_c0_seq1.p1 gnl/MRDRNA2_/MRDRNA2_40375_c0~~gnl/MRDRNA2_/MRDRNA2_40375_c0_seq1.p1  ORF type:complete len:557 (-),score=131.73 gnl/MRDRNA2_/MRDRNA2_40375_c0_seq1:257-1927(-)